MLHMDRGRGSFPRCESSFPTFVSLHGTSKQSSCSDSRTSYSERRRITSRFEIAYIRFQGDIFFVGAAHDSYFFSPSSLGAILGEVYFLSSFACEARPARSSANAHTRYCGLCMYLVRSFPLFHRIHTFPSETSFLSLRRSISLENDVIELEEERCS